jgi:hypothetical protein
MIRWEMKGKDDKCPIKFNGVPYIWIGSQDYHCHQGKDKNIRSKQNYKAKRAKLLMQDHSAHVTMRRATQPIKKMECPVKFAAKKLINLPKV